MKKLLSLVLTLVMLLSVASMAISCGGNNEDGEKIGELESPLPQKELVKFDVPDTFKIGIITLHDEKSTYDLNFINSIKRCATTLGLKDDQVLFKKGVGEDDTCYDAAADLVDQGCSIVFADSFGHEDFLIKAAKEFTNVQFCHATGTKAHTENLPNFHNAFASIYEGRYLAGIAAGLKLNEMIEKGKITAAEAVMGYVGAFTYAEVMSGYSSFYLGAKSVCPSVTMKVRFTGSWYDETKEKNAANALIKDGCVLISQHADSLGAPSACEDAGVPNVSYNGSTIEAGETTFIVSSMIDWAPYFHYIIKCVCDGEAIATDWTGTIETGSIVLSKINGDVAAEGTLEALTQAVADLKSGNVKVFDVTKDNYMLKDGKKITSFPADVDTDPDFTADHEVIINDIFDESNSESFRSAPYFNLELDGITLLDRAY